MVQKGEEGGGQGLREAAAAAAATAAAAAVVGGGETGDAVAHHDGEEAVEAGRSRHVDDGVELGEVGIPVQVDDRGEGLERGRLGVQGWKKPGFFILKKNPAQWVFLAFFLGFFRVFGFLFYFFEERVFRIFPVSRILLGASRL
jgi:hypothetical protein